MILPADDLRVEITVMDALEMTAEATDVLLVVIDDTTLVAGPTLSGASTQRNPEVSP